MNEGRPDPYEEQVAGSSAPGGVGAARVGWAARRARAISGDALFVLRDPVVPILMLAGLFDGISDNWVHAGVLWAVAVAVGYDDRKRRRGLERPQRAILGGRGRPWWGSGLARVGGVAACLAYAAIGGSYARYTWPDTVTILIPASVVLLLTWRGPLRDREAPGALDTFGVLAWSSIFVAAALWELTALLAQPSLRVSSYAHPTISYLMDPVLASHLGRSLTLAAWLGLGWWLLGGATLEPRSVPDPEARS